jgi:hypothetical protein
VQPDTLEAAFNSNKDSGMVEHLRRRDFLKLGVRVCAGISMAPMISGCTGIPGLREKVEDIQWDANPIIPIPASGCYTGLNVKSPFTPRHGEPAKNNRELFDSAWFESNAGKVPAIYSLDGKSASREEFPAAICNQLYSQGIIPVISYDSIPDWSRVVQGNYDRAMEEFASGAVKFGKPFFITPWPECNREAHAKGKPLPGREKSTDFIIAWIHMHDIFGRAGANKYAIWGFHLAAYADQIKIFGWDLADDFFDWIGFGIYNRVRRTGRNYSFKKLFDHAYEWVRKYHPTKPVALFGLGTSNISSQANWIKNTYNRIVKRYPAVKLAVYSIEEWGQGDESKIDSSELNPEAKRALQEVMSAPYFIGHKSEYFDQIFKNLQK